MPKQIKCCNLREYFFREGWAISFLKYRINLKRCQKLKKKSHLKLLTGLSLLWNSSIITSLNVPTSSDFIAIVLN